MKKQVNPANPLPRELVKELTTINTLKGMTNIVMDFVSIGLIITATILINNPLVYIVAIPLIANRQHSLLIQMHDAAHGNISKNKKINNLVGELVLAWPMFFRMESYKKSHNLHHSFSNTNKDPDFIEERFPQSQETLRKNLLKDLCGLGVFSQFKKLKKLKTKTSPSVKAGRAIYYLTLVSVITYFGVWSEFLIFWILPLFTWLSFILQVRSVADHSGPDLQFKEHPFNTRTVEPNLFDRLFLAPNNCSYHLAHSIYPKVPTYNLKRCHEEIMKHQVFQEKARVTNGFINFFKEFPRTEAEVEEKGFDFYYAK